VFRIREQALALVLHGCIAFLAWWEKFDPSRRDFVIAPCGSDTGIDAQHQMKMIAHDRIGFDRHGEAFADKADSGFGPGLAMFEVLPGVSVDAAEEGAPHAALDAVIRASGIGRRDMGSGTSHVV
jgi:hypothetical protein